MKKVVLLFHYTQSGIWLMALCLGPLLVLQLLASGCSNDDDKEAPMLEVSPENLQLDSKGEGVLTITSNGLWSVSTTVEWLSFSMMSGVGNGQVTIRTIDSSASDRTDIVTVKGEGTSRQILVTQTGNGTMTTNPSNPSTPTQNTVQTFNVGGVSFNLIRVDGGTFWMGATSEQSRDADSDETPAHQVTLSTYYIGETEVTQHLWQVVTGKTLPAIYGDEYEFEDGRRAYGLGKGIGNNRPIYDVSWDDCQEFITKLNNMTGKTFRLPTEAEWEYAARGGMKSMGYKYAGSYVINDIAWYDRYSKGAQDVATKHPNELGLYDMSGNVSEWCNDWYGRYSSVEQTNPTGPTTGSDHVERGGSWDTTATTCRVSWRHHYTPSFKSTQIGLRLVLQ